MEKLRKLLIAWNVAPLAVVVFLCSLTYMLVSNLVGMPCGTDPTQYGALTVLIATMGGILYKVYNSLQKDNKKDEDE